MKITYILPHSPESCGLVAEGFIDFNHFSHAYRKHIEKLGNDTELFYLGKEKNVIKLKNQTTQFPISFGSTFGKEFSLSLLKYLLKLKTDMVHIHGYRQLNIVPILVILYLKKVPMVVQHHGGAYNYSKVKVRLYYKALKFILMIPNQIITVNKNEIENLKKAGIKEKKIKYIPVGIDKSEYYPELKEIARKKLSLYQDKKYILFVGRMVKLKGTEYLLKSISELRQIYPDITLLLIGDGPETKNLKVLCKKEKLEENIKFLGYISEPEILRTYYNASDVCVFPSLAEGLSIVTLEALACMKPVVGTKAHPMLINEENGLLAETESSESLAKKIFMLLSNPELAKKLSINGYYYTVKNFSWENVTEELNKIYYELSMSKTKN